MSNHSIHEEESKTEAEEGEVRVSVSEFSSLAAGSLLYLSSPGLACTAVTEGRWGEETEHFLHKITHHEHHDHHHEEDEASHNDTHTHEEEHQHERIDAHGLESLLRGLDEHYKPSRNESCVTPSAIMAAVNASSAGASEIEVGAVMGRVLYHALQGHCFINRFLPEESYFLDYIMQRIGSEDFTIHDLEALMRSLKLGPSLEKEHEHEHKHHEDEHHEDEHADHDHSDQRRRKRSTHEHQEEHRGNNTEAPCFSAEELVLIHGMENSSAASSLDRSDLARLSPALVQQILSGACVGDTERPQPNELTTAERYIYATIANMVITLTSMFGIVVLLCTSCTDVFQLSIQFCISLAVGTLTGDALLHLMPMFLGLHVHSSEGGSHQDHNHKDGSHDYIYKILVVLAGIYYFYLMEAIFSLVTRKDNHYHHPHHHREESEPHHCDHGRVLEMYQQKKKQQKSQSPSKTDLVDCEDDNRSFPKPTERSREQRLLPYMITIGDGIHNFADGLAIGAAFSLSWRSGLATSVAVLCHELPHELGDFAILLHSGLSVRRALLLNVGSAMTSFVGLYIALSVATDLATKQWIAAVTAGLFLYVGLADMLSTMVHSSNKRPWLMFLLQNIGLLSGWAILLLLSLFEDKIGL
ncbi:zinc transporter ZIP4-like [Myripristis murdjan]|nr:zinc transporter ZIP4-like [Myripristis murdjan]